MAHGTAHGTEPLACGPWCVAHSTWHVVHITQHTARGSRQRQCAGQGQEQSASAASAAVAWISGLRHSGMDGGSIQLESGGCSKAPRLESAGAALQAASHESPSI